MASFAGDSADRTLRSSCRGYRPTDGAEGGRGAHDQLKATSPGPTLQMMTAVVASSGDLRVF